MRYLFIVSKYGVDIQTNGRVLSSIIEEMLKDGNEVVCLSESDSVKEYDYKGVKVYSVKQALHSSLRKQNKSSGRLLEILTEVLFYFSYPSHDKLVEKRMYRKLCELDELYDFDCIYAIYRKYSNVGALLKFKKRCPEKKCGVLFFDLLEAFIPRLYSAGIYRRLCRMQYRKIGKVFDKVFLPNDGNCESWGFLPASKREMLYYPGFTKRRIINAVSTGKSAKDRTITVIFAGTLNSTYRNPAPLFEVLKVLNDMGYKTTLKLYVKGNCDSIIEKAENELHLDIIKESLIDKEKLLTEYQQADILVNISNHKVKATPSKVFELMSTGKPVLNIVHDKEDTTTAYFDKYKMAHSIFAYKDIAGQAKGTAMFLDNAHDLTEEEYSAVESQFERNTPYNVYQSIRNI